ncbi:MAG: SDR family NAD(P)-dependent oxidoreductase, partial [Anaerolineaceae bacterium]|nr:SDR family NAD(P)-dependent oxidoreductase [Anaerolineaceae bacterium]
MLNSLMDFKNKIVIITGASSGIGQATAEIFAKCGATVIINYHSNDAGAKQTLDLVKAAGGTGVIKKADISKPE